MVFICVHLCSSEDNFFFSFRAVSSCLVVRPNNETTKHTKTHETKTLPYPCLSVDYLFLIRIIRVIRGQLFLRRSGAEGRSFAWRAGEGRQIGIGVTALTKQLAEHFGAERGVMINSVREGSPAAKAGLKAGDIIVEIDGKPVNSDMDLIRSINEKKEGDVSLTIVRDTKQQTITVTPEASKDAGFMFRTGDDDGVFAPGAPALPSQMSIPRPPMPGVPGKLTTLFPGRVL